MKLGHAIVGVRKKRKVRFPGVCADARALGVNHRTLQRCLAGEGAWRSKILVARYRQLKGQTLSTAQTDLISKFTRRQAVKPNTRPHS